MGHSEVADVRANLSEAALNHAMISERTARLTITERPITAFIYLQILDVMTTICFLANGVTEGNPLVRFMIRTTENPLLGLFIVKCMAVVLGLYAWKTGRDAVLRKANVFFAILVVWNLVAAIGGAAH
jgi:hypothetical protein